MLFFLCVSTYKREPKEANQKNKKIRKKNNNNKNNKPKTKREREKNARKNGTEIQKDTKLIRV